MRIDRRDFITSIGGAAAVSLMSHEAKAEALETYMSERPEAAQENRFPSAADVEQAQNYLEIGTLSAPNSKARDRSRALLFLNGADEIRTRDLRRDRPAF